MFTIDELEMMLKSLASTCRNLSLKVAQLSTENDTLKKDLQDVQKELDTFKHPF